MEGIANGPKLDFERDLHDANPAYKSLVDEARHVREDRDRSLPGFARDALLTSHSEVFIPLLWKREDRQNPPMVLTDVFRTYGYKESSQELLEYLDSKLRGQSIINLASGDSGALTVTLRKFAPKAIVNVDINNPAGVAKRGSRESEVWVGEDVLEFVSRLPNEYGSVTISGFDSHVVPSEPYHKALLREILRVLSPQGILFGSQASVLVYAANEPALQKVSVAELSERDITIFEGKGD